MVRIYVIDNGGQWTHREWRTLRDLEVETQIVPNTTLLKDLQKESRKTNFDYPPMAHNPPSTPSN